MKPYPEYKTTGLPWLPKIPKHWEIRKMKYLFSERSEKGFPDEPLLAATQNHGVIPKDLYESRTVVAQKDLHLLKLVRVGDFVISLRSFQGGIEYAYYQGIISPAYTVMIPKDKSLGIDYFRLLAKSKPFVKLLQTCVTGIREGQNVDWPTLKRNFIPIPPLDEQAKIVRYLDVMTAKIDKLIAAKKKQIALLQEKKQAVINQAVTRGLNPEVELKDSGIDWLGKIPKHWARDKVSRLFGFIGSGTTPSVGDQSFNDEKECIPWINSGDLYYADPFIPHISKKLPEAFLAKYSALKKYPENTIVIAMYGASIGNLGISREVACCNQACCCLWGPNSNITLLFSYYALLACKSVWQEKSNGGGQPNISQEIVRQTWLPVPPLVEQIGIARKLDLFSDGLRTVIQNLEKEIALCADYKNSLISSIVTGAVDVREIEISSAELMWEDAEGMCATRD